MEFEELERLKNQANPLRSVLSIMRAQNGILATAELWKKQSIFAAIEAAARTADLRRMQSSIDAYVSSPLGQAFGRYLENSDHVRRLWEQAQDPLESVRKLTLSSYGEIGEVLKQFATRSAVENLVQVVADHTYSDPSDDSEFEARLSKIEEVLERLHSKQNDESKWELWIAITSMIMMLVIFVSQTHSDGEMERRLLDETSRGDKSIEATLSQQEQKLDRLISSIEQLASKIPSPQPPPICRLRG